MKSNNIRLKDIARMQHSIDILEEVKMLDDTLYSYNPEYMYALEDAIQVLKLYIHNQEISIVPKEPEFLHMLGDWTAKFKCPDCGRIFTYDVRDTDIFYCSKCGTCMKMEE